MKVLELKGYKSLRAWNAYSVLMLGLKMLPAYQGLKYEDFFTTIDNMSPADQEKIIREAVNFVDLSQSEVESIIGFCADVNGIPYGPENMGNLNPLELREIIVAVCLKISKIKVELVTDEEKKNLKIFP